jgi:hypothetical protein
MDWKDFVVVVAGPAYAFLVVSAIGAYLYLKGRIEKVEEKAIKVTTEVRQEIQSMTIEIMKQYVPKEDVLRLENRLLSAISSIEQKLDRMISQ